MQWVSPNIEGPCPSPRESHSAVTMGSKLIIYGGMNGHRLGDLWILNVGMLLCNIVTMVMLMFRCNAMVYANTHWNITVATELAHCMYDQGQVSAAWLM